MLRGYRRYILAALGGLAALGVITSAWLYSYSEFYEPAEQEYPAERYQPARDALNPVSPAIEQKQPKAYDPRCNNPKEREDSDLCAQWGAVRAVSETNRLTRVALKLGFVGFWIAMLGGLFGAVGTFFLVMTFRENRRAADAAHDANRPWVEVNIDNVVLSISKEYGASSSAELSLTNRGNSPALRVRTASMPFPIREMPHLPRMSVIAFLEDELHKIDSSKGQFGKTLFPTQEDAAETFGACPPHYIIDALSAPSEHIHWVILIGVTYQFGDRVAWTVKTYSLPIQKEGINYDLASTQHRFKFPGRDLRDAFDGYAT